MKLINIKPTVFEAFDNFDDSGLMSDRTALLVQLRRKERALLHAMMSENDVTRHLQLTTLRNNIHKQILRLEKEETTERANAIQQSNDVSTPAVSVANIPPKLSAGKYKFNNPYFQGVDNRFVGDPKHFKWSPQLLKQYVRLNDILTSRGLERFTLMYASTARVSHVNLSNFALFGANGKVIWRKYDMGHASGKNWIYVDGTKYKTTHVLTDSIFDPAKVDTVFDPVVEAK